MKPCPLEPSINAATTGASWEENREWDRERPAIVFDDQPLESVLYGQVGDDQTLASLFGRARELVDFMRDAYRAKDSEKVFEACQALAADDQLISWGMCVELTALLDAMVPHYPCPVLPVSLTPLCPLLEKIWAMGWEKKNHALLERMATAAFRCHEHCGQYETAREVLRWLLENRRRQGDRYHVAITLNNLAFEYLLEGRWQEAILGFEEAAMLFQTIGNAVQAANSRANYWMAQFEPSKPDEVENSETELQELEDILTRAMSWQARKPRILLAKVAEQRGDLEEAIHWVEKAIQACQGSGTRYPETDAHYLERLKEGRGKLERGPTSC